MTGRNWCRSGHAVGRTEALAAPLTTLLVAVVDQLGAAVGIDAPKGAFAWFVLGSCHLYKVPIIK